MKKRYAHVCGSKWTEYNIQVSAEAKAAGFAIVENLPFHVYRPAQDLANAIHESTVKYLSRKKKGG